MTTIITSGSLSIKLLSWIIENNNLSSTRHGVEKSTIISLIASIISFATLSALKSYNKQLQNFFGSC